MSERWLDPGDPNDIDLLARAIYADNPDLEPYCQRCFMILRSADHIERLEAELADLYLWWVDALERVTCVIQ
jgi:hypothetical protein